MNEQATIIVVEDDPGLRELLVEELESEQYSVVAVDSVEHAWGAIEVHQPDLVISDLRLPGANGMSMLPHLQ